MLSAIWKWVTSSDSRPFLNDDYEQLSARLETAITQGHRPGIISCLEEISKRTRTRHKYVQLVDRATEVLRETQALIYSSAYIADEGKNIESVSTSNPSKPLARKQPQSEDFRLDFQRSTGSDPTIKLEEQHHRSSEDALESLSTDSQYETSDYLQEADSDAPLFHISPSSRDLLISKLQIDHRLRSKLIGAGILHLRELNGLTKQEMLLMRGITLKNLDKLVQELTNRGLLSSSHLSTPASESNSVTQPLTNNTNGSLVMPELSQTLQENDSDLSSGEQYTRQGLEDKVSTKPDPIETFELDVGRSLGEFF